jgi:sulfane dehydrogenase subunit SoxC
MGEPNNFADYDEKTRAQIEAMVEAERRALAKRRGELEACDCKAGMFPNPCRRNVLFAAGSALAVGTASFLLPARAAEQKAPAGAVWRDVPDDPAKVPGTAIAEDGGYGSRSQFETEVRWRFPTPTTLSSWTMTPLDKSQGILTPSALHFERHHGGIPTIDPDRHQLFVHGMVERPKKFTMADLRRFPSVSRLHFIECSGNGLTEWRKPTLKTVQGTHGLLSTSEWTGVQFATLAREVGLKEGAAWVLAEGADSAVMTRSIPRGSRASKSRPTAARIGASRRCRTRCCRSARRVSASPGSGTAGRQSCRAALRMRPAMCSRV